MVTDSMAGKARIGGKARWSNGGYLCVSRHGFANSGDSIGGSVGENEWAA